MSSENEIIVVADDWDHPASRMLIDVLLENYNIKARIWRSDYFIQNEHEVSNTEVFITIGGYNYNDVTKKYQRLIQNKLYEDKEIFTGTGFHKAFIWGKQEWESTEKAVKYFIKNYLKKFIEDNFPKQTNTKPDPKPVENPPIIVKETPTDYPEEQKYDKEFYEIDEGIFKLKYFDEEALIKDSTPLQYCYYVLSRPHRQISLTEIFCGVNDEEPNYIAPLIEGAVIDKNVNKTVVENLINDYNEKILLLERAKLIIFQEEDALNGIFHDGDIDIDATKPTSKFDKEKEKERIKKAKELALRYLDSMDRLEKELEAYVDIVKKLNEQLKYQPKEVSNERNRYASRIRMGFSSFYKVLKAKKLYRLHDYLNSNIDVYNGYIYHPDDDFTTWKLTK